MKRILYIDFENVSTMGLRGIDELTKHDHVKIFLGPKCSKMSLIDADIIFHSEATVELIKNDQIGKNALDFIIMVHLGYDIAKKVADAFFIISNDKGYDPAIHEMISMTGETIERLPGIRSVLERKEEKMGLFAGLFGKKTPQVDNTTQHEVIGKNAKGKKNAGKSAAGGEANRGSRSEGNRNGNNRNNGQQRRDSGRERNGSGKYIEGGRTSGKYVESGKNRNTERSKADNASQPRKQDNRKNEKKKNEVLLDTTTVVRKVVVADRPVEAKSVVPESKSVQQEVVSEPVKKTVQEVAKPEITIVTHDTVQGTTVTKKVEVPDTPDTDSKQYMQELLRQTLEEPEEEIPKIKKRSNSTKVEQKKQAPVTEEAKKTEAPAKIAQLKEVESSHNAPITEQEEALIQQALNECVGKEEFHNYLSQKLRDNDRVAYLYKTEKKKVFEISQEEKRVVSVAMEQCNSEDALYGYLMSEIKNSERAAAIYQRERKHLPKNR